MKNWLTLKPFFHFSNLRQKIEKWSNDVNETMSSFFHFFSKINKWKNETIKKTLPNSFIFYFVFKQQKNEKMSNSHF